MKFVYFLFFTAWLGVSAAGAVYLAHYANTPAEAAAAEYPHVFPAESALPRNNDRPALIFFAHPKCPCTRASLNELNRLVTELDGKLQIYFVFTKPAEADETWAETDLRAKAETIPDARVLVDEDERETKLFNAQTSGLILLYDRAGNLRYNGGITAARGHEGDSAARRAIFNIVAHDLEQTAKMDVFGCPLRDKNCVK